MMQPPSRGPEWKTLMGKPRLRVRTVHVGMFTLA
ncbi:hypothetical protein TBK1r_29830 [Stieleria magnilauensis]|uniref:Uncharacterized protein n=1 Tax=Stieleria magnilauensis TaxID=2527963 RepID=A0ABX5XST8_9BACT|nr:hypothetical protein TBK1r_29830 [Planctomycetes bacterium TBK1r]